MLMTGRQTMSSVRIEQTVINARSFVRIDIVVFDQKNVGEVRVRVVTI